MEEEKIKLIDEIVKNHPSCGIEKGWSWYTGGMTDNGEWYFRKMLDVPMEELKTFLDSIIEEKNKYHPPMTPQEEIDSKIYFQLPNGIFTTKYNLDKFEEINKRIQAKIIWGNNEPIGN